MGKKGGQKKRKSGGGGGGFQVVHEDGNAGKRASGMGGPGGSDSEDDVEAIRRANAGAAAKRQKVEEKRDIKEKKRAQEKMGGKGAADGQEGRGAISKGASKKQQAEQKPFRDLTGLGVIKGNPAKEAGSSSGKKGKKEAVGSRSSSDKKGQRQASAPASKRGKGNEVDDEDDEDDGMNEFEEEEEGEEEEESSSEEEDSEDEEDMGLMLKAGAFREQRKGGHDEFEEDSNEGSDFEELDVVFENLDPQEGDFHGMKLFLSDLLDGEAFDSSGLADEILALSGKVGTVVKVEDADDVMGIVCAVPMGAAAWSKQVAKYLRSKCPQSMQGKLQDALSSAGTSLVVSERMANMPQEMALPLLRGLFDEVKKTKLKYDKYVVLSRYLVEQRGRGKGGKGGGGDPYYVKAEDEIYRKNSSISFDFALNRPSEEGYDWRGLCCIVPSGKIEKILKDVLELVGDLAYQNQQ